MKPFAFLCKTPSYAKMNDCGQYNGYIAFPRELAGRLWTRDEDLYDNYHFSQEACDEFVEVTLATYTTLEKFGEILPITAIPQEAADGETFVVFGFDTCHSWNSWKEYDYKKVRELTLEWFRIVNEELAE